MRDNNQDWLLHEMGQLEEQGSDSLPASEMLVAFREGSLDEDEALALEARLGQDRAARQELARLAGVNIGDPAAGTKARILDAFDGEVSRRAQARLAQSSKHRLRQRWPAAAAIAASLLLAVTLATTGPEPLPAQLDYEVAGYGLARERSLPTPSKTIEALPETMIRLVVTPREVAEDEVEFGLYRHQADELKRLLPGTALRLELERGSATFEARAADLLATSEREQRIFVVVSRPGNLPQRLSITAGSSPKEALAKGGERLVYEQQIRLVKDSQ